MKFSRQATYSGIPGTLKDINGEMKAIMNKKPSASHIATILVVDDDKRNLKLLDSLLRAANYRTALATNGREALQCVAE